MADSRALTRTEPYLAPSHGTAVGHAGTIRRSGIAPLDPVGLVGLAPNFGLAEQPRAASAIRPRVDTTQLSRAVVAMTRPVWYRISLTRLSTPTPPSPVLLPDAITDWA